jgi:transposase-like protein
MGRKAEPHSIRSTAAAVGVARSSLHRWTKRHGLNLADKPALAALLAERNRPAPAKP